MSWRMTVLGLLIGSVLAPAVAGAERKAPPWEKPIQTGRYLFLKNCSVCHEINKAESEKLGPSLFRLFQNEKLPFSGGKPSVEFVQVKIKFGGDIMPAFDSWLTEEQIDQIIAFIKTKH